jgi:hypothetical protein
MQFVRGLQHLAIRAKHRSAAQPQLHELQRHDPIVDVAKFDPGKFEQVDLDPTGGQLVQQRLD